MIRRSVIYSIILLIIGVTAVAEGKYKSYTKKSVYENLLKFSVDKDQFIATLYGDNDTVTTVFNREDASSTEEGTYLKGRPFLTDQGFVLPAETIPVNSIERIETKDDKNGFQIHFMGKTDSESTKTFRQKKNRITIKDNINIATGEFIRGLVVAFWGNIEIYGEVNEDVVAVFGDITIGDQAVIRGDVTALNGEVKTSKHATIYGEIRASHANNKYSYKSLSRWYRRDKYFTECGHFYYNRVDGAAPYLGVKFIDEDSLLPEVTVYGGYGFSSEDWRYRFAVSQSFFLSNPLTIGASAYRRLASDDDHLLSEVQNTVFALIATEDYKDYYEAEGIYAFVSFRPYRHLSLESGVQFEKHHAVEAHRELWSLFGGSKRFPNNFSSLPDDLRVSGLQEIDSGKMVALLGRLNFSTLKDRIDWRQSFWNIRAEFEWLPSNWNDDFNFNRLRLKIGRMQKVNRYSRIYSSMALGTSDGYLPIHRKFYLGGYGTLLGYRHKEFYGSRFWMANAEYGITVPHTDVTAWLFYSTGQIAQRYTRLGDAEVKHSLGIGISFDNSIRFNVARRLDTSEASFEINLNLGFDY